MTEQKAKRLIVAGTVGAVLLIVVLLMVMIYQMIHITVYNRRIEEYNQKIAQYEQLIKDGEETKETYSLRWWIEREARRLGLVYEGEKD